MALDWSIAMHRFGFRLLTSATKEEFRNALKLLEDFRGHGWLLAGVEQGFSGGRPGGRFLVVHGSARETIAFPLDDASRPEFHTALRKVADLPAGQWSVAGIEMEIADGQPSGVIVLQETRGIRPAASLRAGDDKRAAASAVKLHRSRKRKPSIYDLNEEAALTALRLGAGEQAEELRALLGDSYFALLGDLSRRSPPKRASFGKAFVLPGIMGSKLGTRKKLGFIGYSDVIWLDPVDMRLGRMDELTLTRDGRAQHGTQSVGVLYSFYLRLKLNLQLAGFDAEFYDYDWRRPVRDLGAEFARVLNQQKGPVTIVAHSMGGIVTRAALKAGATKVRRLIMIGTPNHGSFVPAQALRGAYPFLKTLSVIFDRDLASVTEDIFATFSGLYDLLPAKAKFKNFDVFNPAQWPKSPPHFRPDLLKAAAQAQELLQPPDDRFHLICGVNQDTVVDVRVEEDEFVFLQTKDGDGTVPRISAELPGCESRTYYVEGSHGLLPNYGIVCDLAVDLATNGKTSIETLAWQPPTTPPVEIKESALRSAPLAVRGLKRGEEPSPAVFREMLRPLLGLPEEPAASSAPTAPGAPPLPIPKPGEAMFAHELKGVIVGRRRQRQLEVAFVANSLTAVPSRAYVLGLFQGVAPAGAALAADALMNGMISDFVRRRMLNGRLGEVFIVPKGRSFVPADHVIFVGLGPFDHFKNIQANDACARDAMRLICESVVRTCLHANVEEFATVLLGGSAAEKTSDAVGLFMRSFVEALESADPLRRIRRITLCETDPQRIAELRAELLRLATTDLFDDVELELRDLPQAAAASPALPTIAPARGAAQPRRPAPLYLLARMFDPSLSATDQSQNRGSSRRAGAGPSGRSIVLETSLLTPLSKAAVLTARCERPIAHKEKLLAPIKSDDFDEEDLQRLGAELAAFVFDQPMQRALQRLANEWRELPLIVVHDTVASQLPWEAFRLGDWSPALSGGVIRQHLDANFSVAKWMEHRAEDAFLDVLLVTNPTSDLDGAEAEGDAVRTLLNKVANVRLTERRRSQATRVQLLSDFRSGQFDVVHYAGHAFFDAAHPARTGAICAGREVLTGADLAGLASLPSLVFFNACESGRIRGRPAVQVNATRKGKREPSEKNTSLANAFIRGGVANFLGTYWPVGDYAAKKFSETFYPQLVAGKSVGEAVLAGRRAVEQSDSVDWADYILYGSPDFVLKRSET